jgi:hypothetical protein
MFDIMETEEEEEQSGREEQTGSRQEENTREEQTGSRQENSINIQDQNYDIEKTLHYIIYCWTHGDIDNDVMFDIISCLKNLKDGFSVSFLLDPYSGEILNIETWFNEYGYENLVNYL